MRTILNCVLFVIIIAALLLGLTLETSASIREPWTWILAIVGAAIFEGGTYLIYRTRQKPTQHTR